MDFNEEKMLKQRQDRQSGTPEIVDFLLQLQYKVSLGIAPKLCQPL